MPILQFVFKAIGKKVCATTRVQMLLCCVTVQCRFPKIAASSSSKILHCLPKAIQRTLSYCKLRLYLLQLSLLCQQWLSWCSLNIPKSLGNTYTSLSHASNSEFMSPPKVCPGPAASFCKVHLDFHLPFLHGFNYAAITWPWLASRSTASVSPTLQL